MCALENCSGVLENAAGFARLDTYIYGPVTKWRHWGMFIHWGNKQTSHSLEHCKRRDATSTEFLEVQIPPCVLVYGWDS